MKKILLVVLYLVATSAELFAQKTEWNFSTDAITGWVAGRSSIELSNGKLVVKDFTDAGDPTLRFNYASGSYLKGNNFRYVIIRAKNNTPSTNWRFYFYYNTPTVNNNTAQPKIQLNFVANDNQFRDYIFEVAAETNAAPVGGVTVGAAWSDAANNITGIRLDLPDENNITKIGKTNTVEIESIRLVNTLPVTLISYDAKMVQDGKVTIKWNTSNEINNSHYTIERSSDGKTFQPLTKISAKEAGSLYHYSFTDILPNYGANYYRLTQFDFDGKSTVLGITNANVTLKNDSYIIYPNPITDKKINIIVNAINKQNLLVEITSLQGKKVFERTYNVNQNYNLEIELDKAIPSGIYVVKLGDFKRTIVIN